MGLLLVVVAGFLNGSWNAAFAPGWATGKDDLQYHFAWVLFQVYAALLNIPIFLYWAGGPQHVKSVVEEVSGASIALVVHFSVLWGAGSVGFGLACNIAGVGLGTNLTMGVVMILGTFLPLCLEGAVATAAGGVVIAGVVLCCVGLAFSVQSLQIRDLDEIRISNSSDQQSKNDDKTVARIGGDSEQKDLAIDKMACETETDSDKEEYSSFQKVAVCVLAGIFASQLQFAFVFGDDMADLSAANDEIPPSGTNAVIWLFAISLGAPVSIVYGFCSSPSRIPFSSIWTCPWYRHILLIFTTSIPWVTHIHLYGYANTFLPDDLAASVAWPVLMMMTVISGMLWSIGLGEWKEASPLARSKLYKGLAVATLGVIAIMASVAVP